ncbi:MAG: hypothetical protein RPU35_00615 [Candidatus Sedimenticola sp. (ex Thyasira tokunagai)]
MSVIQNQSRLDPSELFNLALHANQNNEHGKAIEHLKELISLSPEAGEAYYMLGAIHAEIGMYESAIDEMTTAIRLIPELTSARFQLGLLHLTSGHIDMAEETWSELQIQGNDTDPFFYFCKGLLDLSMDEYQSCIENLTKGIELNHDNGPLNRDMQMMIDETQTAMNNTPTTETASESTEKSKAGQHVLLKAYQNIDEDKNH